jgi:hypothetical protein
VHGEVPVNRRECEHRKEQLCYGLEKQGTIYVCTDANCANVQKAMKKAKKRARLTLT